jgi:hypothetical protein
MRNGRPAAFFNDRVAVLSLQHMGASAVDKCALRLGPIRITAT